jgi:membrane protein implicated in regulation of membrane protease activity
VEGRGRLRINDGVWQAGPTLLLARVKVTGAEGTVLTVTSA